MGDNIYLGDRNGVRTPMQWTSDRNAGFSRADPARLYAPPIMDPVYGYQAVNVEAQERSPSSLLNWMTRIIALRRRHRTFGRGTIRFLAPANRKVLAYMREYEGETILCVANLSRHAQPVELDLRASTAACRSRWSAAPSSRASASSPYLRDARPVRLLLVPACRSTPAPPPPARPGAAVGAQATRRARPAAAAAGAGLGLGVRHRDARDPRARLPAGPPGDAALVRQRRRVACARCAFAITSGSATAPEPAFVTLLDVHVRRRGDRDLPAAGRLPGGRGGRRPCCASRQTW